MKCYSCQKSHLSSCGWSNVADQIPRLFQYFKKSLTGKCTPTFQVSGRCGNRVCYVITHVNQQLILLEARRFHGILGHFHHPNDSLFSPGVKTDSLLWWGVSETRRIYIIILKKNLTTVSLLKVNFQNSDARRRKQGYMAPLSQVGGASSCHIGLFT